MFARLVRRGLWQRKSRALVAVLALTLAATLTAALLNLYVDAQRKIQSEFRLYGANLMVTPRVTAGENSAAELLPGALARQLKRDFVPDRLTAVVPYLYAVVELKGESVVLAGTWLDQFTGLGGFRLTAGDAPGSEAGSDKCWVGAAVAARFDLRPGESVTLRYREATYTCQVAGVVETGQAEDNQVLADLAAVQALAGAAGRLNVILARAGGDAAAPRRQGGMLRTGSGVVESQHDHYRRTEQCCPGQHQARRQIDRFGQAADLVGGPTAHDGTQRPADAYEGKHAFALIDVEHIDHKRPEQAGVEQGDDREPNVKDVANAPSDTGFRVCADQPSA